MIAHTTAAHRLSPCFVLPSFSSPSLLSLRAVNQVYQYYGATNVISLLFMIIRLLKNLNYHPKLAIVSKTIGNAAEDLIHFSVVFVVVVCVYSFMGMVIAGRQVRTLVNPTASRCFSHNVITHLLTFHFSNS